MGVVPAEDTDRNEAVFKDYILYKQGKVKILDLTFKYRVSDSRLHTIAKQVARKRGLEWKTIDWSKFDPL